MNDQEHFFVFRDKSEIQPKIVRQMLRRVISNLGLDALLYDVHSLRAGRSTDLYKLGYSVEQVKQTGRWRSNIVYRYLKL